MTIHFTALYVVSVKTSQADSWKRGHLEPALIMLFTAAGVGINKKNPDPVFFYFLLILYSFFPIIINIIRIILNPDID